MAFIKNYLLLLLLAILVCGTISVSHSKDMVVETDYSETIQKARELVINFLNDTNNKFAPGLVIGVSVGGKQIWIEGFGLANIENNVTMKGETVMQIGSISKSFTVSLASRLAQEGKLDFDIPIRTYLNSDEFPDKMWNGTVVNITLRQLLQMTAGIPNGPSELEVGKCIRCLNQRDRLVFMRDKELDFEPGTNHSYSNFGYELAGAVIESALGNMSFDVAMTRMIRNVLNLNKTAIVNTELITPNIASFYRTDMKTVYNSGMWGDIFLNELHAAGGITATTADMLTYGQAWLDAYLGRSNFFLNQSTAKAAWTPSEASIPSSYMYGMGWVIQNVTGDRPSGSLVIWHNGGTLGCKSMLAIYPETEIIITASVNLAENSIDMFILEGKLADLFAIKNNSTIQSGIIDTELSVSKTLEQKLTIH